MDKLNQEQINSILETRLARLEIYLQKEGHDITKFDGDEDSAMARGNPIQPPIDNRFVAEGCEQFPETH